MASPFTPNAQISVTALIDQGTTDSSGLPVKVPFKFDLKAYLKQVGQTQVVERNQVFKVQGYAVEPTKLPVSLRGAIGVVKFGELQGSIVFSQPLPSIASPFTGDSIVADITIPL